MLEDYLDRMRSRFPDLQYVDLVCGDVVKSAWVRSRSWGADAAQTGTLAAFMSSLGLGVEEADLDAESESDVDSARCDTEDDELPPGVYRDVDGTACMIWTD